MHYTVLKLIQNGSFWRSLTCTQNYLEFKKETEFVDVNPLKTGEETKYECHICEHYPNSSYKNPRPKPVFSTERDLNYHMIVKHGYVSKVYSS